ncbi:hypothetical protein JX265_000766 [Neoarthrinium moseri]|uniref:Uncharacterized protein n=1 Tax=Neoarthrinium moseri TaxID=1658444 RepID=A0A9Q0AV98_9PEZI|nr:uncharacterized protein JN550_007127 [Neoarthrinium moseri]KAI1847516.1 hypothetical protein JX266_006368 [Neoarthrinium moseri]KAI1867396.1 hypothetical protein JN550_007127 [Neoarthrinium moseri]KAI1880526.1 hypothetical protein JX265_000766 [Neoarthrinium moseri]
MTILSILSTVLLSSTAPNASWRFEADGTNVYHGKGPKTCTEFPDGEKIQRNYRVDGKVDKGVWVKFYHNAECKDSWPISELSHETDSFRSFYMIRAYQVCADAYCFTQGNDIVDTIVKDEKENLEVAL